MMTRLAKTVVEPTAKNGFIFTLLGTKWGFLWLWLLIINVAAFLAYGLDKLLAKLKARHEKVPRLPERNLLLLAIVGGGIGAWLGMEVFRHKTQHRSFRVVVPLFTCLWLVIVTGGDSLASNIQLVYNNARLAAKTACELVALAKN